MRLIFIIIFFQIIMEIVCAETPAYIINESDTVKKRKYAIEYIINSEIAQYKCNVSEDDAKEILKIFFAIDKIDISSFMPAVKKGNAILQALRKVLNDKQNSIEVYDKEQLNLVGVSRQEWDSYVAKYRTSESLKRFEKMIPDNMDIILKTGVVSLIPLLERWLLFQKIIFELKSTKGVSKDEKLWWKNKLAPYRLDNIELQGDDIMRAISIPFSQEKENALKLFFDKRLP